MPEMSRRQRQRSQPKVSIAAEQQQLGVQQQRFFASSDPLTYASAASPPLPRAAVSEEGLSVSTSPPFSPPLSQGQMLPMGVVPQGSSPPHQMYPSSQLPPGYMMYPSPPQYNQAPVSWGFPVTVVAPPRDAYSQPRTQWVPQAPMYESPRVPFPTVYARPAVHQVFEAKSESFREKKHLADQSAMDALGKPVRPGVGLFVFHLPPTMRDDGLFRLFEEENCGTVLSCRVMRHERTNESRGFGFVNFATIEGARLAIQRLNGRRIGNKFLKVEFKKEPRLSEEASAEPTPETTPGGVSESPPHLKFSLDSQSGEIGTPSPVYSSTGSTPQITPAVLDEASAAKTAVPDLSWPPAGHAFSPQGRLLPGAAPQASRASQQTADDALKRKPTSKPALSPGAQYLVPLVQQGPGRQQTVVFYQQVPQYAYAPPAMVITVPPQQPSSPGAAEHS